MYQGKFDAKSRGQKAPDEALQNILDARTAAIAEREAKEKQAAARRAAAQQAAARKAAGVKQNPVTMQVPNGRPTGTAKPAQQAPARPVRQAPPVQAPAKPKKSGPRIGSVIFYTLYFLMILVFAAGTFGTLVWLNGWLQKYEAAQPTLKCQEVFDELFAHPDWAKLYDMAGIKNTDYEGVDQYVEYMKEKVGDQKLEYVETSAGLSGDKKYIVRLGKEKIATFTLEGKGESVIDIPDWTLGKVELFFSRQQGYKISKLDGHTAYVNGVPLGDEYTIQIASTKADDYLPAGVTGIRTCIQSISNLMAKPTVTVYSPTGEEMPVVYDEETGTFVEQTTANTMTDEERDVALGAMKARAEFMINASGARAAVAKYYDGSSAAYNEILKMASELWMNSDNGHRFTSEELNGFAKYNDELFSVHGVVVMNVTCKDNTTKDYTIDQSLFFRKKDGKWVCYDYTNEDVSQPVGQVRLTYMNNGEELKSEFVKTNATSLLTPVITVPEGKVFSGWYKEEIDPSGKTVRTIVFTPDENGNVTLTPGSSLEPMVLYPMFENAE